MMIQAYRADYCFMTEEEAQDQLLFSGLKRSDFKIGILFRRAPEQKAIIASGFSETDQVQETRELGAGSCIRKPYTLQQLSVAVWKELKDESRLPLLSDIRKNKTIK